MMLKTAGQVILACFIAVLLVIAYFVVSFVYANGPSSANTPQQMFQNVICNPIPVGISNLQGVCDTWQGYYLYLRFNASNADIDAIIAQGFKAASWTDISYRFQLDPSWDNFTPKWGPEAIVSKECYELSNVRNGWTHFGTHYLVIDRSTGTVYFVGLGA